MCWMQKALQTAHIGISIFDPAANKYLYNYQGDKYFVPASNIKIPTCYAAMKYLGDSLVGLRYAGNFEKQMVIVPTGDPTFLHPDFTTQNVYTFLKKVTGDILFDESDIGVQALGDGWSWNDYNQYYMAERSVMPMYGNVVRISGNLKNLKVQPEFFKYKISTDPLKGLTPNIDSFYPISASRMKQENSFLVRGSESKKGNVIEIPFHTWELGILFRLLKDTLGFDKITFSTFNLRYQPSVKKIHSQPTDSLLKPMMHRSDNFFVTSL